MAVFQDYGLEDFRGFRSEDPKISTDGVAAYELARLLYRTFHTRHYQPRNAFG